MKVGIIGAGTMGSGIAQAFAQTNGYEVFLCDINEQFAANGKSKIAKGFEKRIAKGDVFFLFPGQWHSYRPFNNTGWDEYWITFKGDYFFNLLNYSSTVQATSSSMNCLYLVIIIASPLAFLLLTNLGLIIIAPVRL